jgi:hypothetical protein
MAIPNSSSSAEKSVRMSEFELRGRVAGDYTAVNCPKVQIGGWPLATLAAYKRVSQVSI